VLNYWYGAFATSRLWIVHVAFPDCAGDTNLTVTVVFSPQALYLAPPETRERGDGEDRCGWFRHHGKHRLDFG
jgi:hypothetical protein